VSANEQCLLAVRSLLFPGHNICKRCELKKETENSYLQPISKGLSIGRQEIDMKQKLLVYALNAFAIVFLMTSGVAIGLRWGVCDGFDREYAQYE